MTIFCVWAGELARENDSNISQVSKRQLPLLLLTEVMSRLNANEWGANESILIGQAHVIAPMLLKPDANNDLVHTTKK